MCSRMATATRKCQVSVYIPVLYAYSGDGSGGKQSIIQFKGFAGDSRHEAWLANLPVRERWRRAKRARIDALRKQP